MARMSSGGGCGGGGGGGGRRRRGPGEVSLERALSKLGLATRSVARSLVREGRVAVDGRLVTDPLAPVVPERVRVAIDGREAVPPPPLTALLHKPRGVVTTRADPRGRPTVYACLAGSGAHLVPVGRLAGGPARRAARRLSARAAAGGAAAGHGASAVESVAVRKITLITTGGTIEKIYDEQSGELVNRRSIVRRMLSELRLEDTEVSVFELMSKDSQDMTEADRLRILEAVRASGPEGPGGGSETTGIVILHGTDTLATTGEKLLAEIPAPRVPIVLTGAMRPFDMKQSDALQNLTEALFATGVLAPGIYCVAHGRALPFPGVRKDRERGTFTRSDIATGEARNPN